jgi:hypothetical protein
VVETDYEADGRAPNRIEGCERIVYGDPSAQRGNERFDGVAAGGHAGLATGGAEGLVTLDAIALKQASRRRVGFNRANRFNGTSRPEIMIGNRGDDVLRGNGGDDDLDGGPDDDRLYGGSATT